MPAMAKKIENKLSLLLSIILMKLLTNKRCDDEIPKNLIRFLFKKILINHKSITSSFIKSQKKNE